MIISASRRTDIPAFYSDWFIERIKEGFVLVRNPLNIHQVSKIKLTPDVVDFIVFWTKNPKPLLGKLNELQDYSYYFQFTLNSYDTDIEEYVPNKGKYVLPTFKKLSDMIGKEKVIWRYDPILLNEKYNISYHLENFEKLAKQLSDYTEKCTISFVDLYKKTEKNLKDTNIIPFDDKIIRDIARDLGDIAQQYNIKMDTCAEKIDLSDLGIEHAHCIDPDLMGRLTNGEYCLSKDKNQRKECGCAESIDIGAYNTCKNGCKYCYANYNRQWVLNNCAQHNNSSELLCDKLNDILDIISERKMRSVKKAKIYEQNQLKLNI